MRDRSTRAGTVLALLLTTFMALSLPTESMCQTRHSGPYIWGDELQGSVEYSYRILSGDTVLNGPWHFTASWKDTTATDAVHSLEVHGQYDQQGLMTGPWTYSNKRLQFSSEPVVKGFQVVHDASGVEYKVVGRFENGLANGNWSVVDRSIVDTEPVDTLYMANAVFADGRYAGAISGRWDGMRFSGTATGSGMLHGDWVFEHQFSDGRMLQEHRIHEEGILAFHYFDLGKERYVVRHVGMDNTVDMENEIWEDMRVGRPYFRIIQYSAFTLDQAGSVAQGPVMDSTVHYLEAANTALREALTAFASHHEKPLWNSLTGAQPVDRPTVRVRRYPFAAQEAERLQRNAQRRAGGQAIIDDFFNDAQVDVARHSDEEISMLYEVMRLYRNGLGSLEHAVTVLADPIIEYLDRDVLLPYLLPELSYPDSITFSFKDKRTIRAYDMPPPVNRSAAGPEALDIHMEETYADLQRIRTRVDVILEKYRDESMLVGKEERLVAQRDSIIALFGDEAPQDDRNAYHASVAESMKALAEQEFEAYAALSADEKIARIDTLIACFAEVITTYQRLARLPLRLQSLDELYTRSIWNPYTFTFMEERVKGRVYQAFEEVVLPYVLEDMRQHVRCGRMDTKQDNLVQLYRRMQALREQDTKDMAKQLRRVNDPLLLIELLGVTVDLN